MLARLLLGSVAMLTVAADRAGSLGESFAWLLGHWVYDDAAAADGPGGGDHWIGIGSGYAVREAPDGNEGASGAERVELVSGAGGAVFYRQSRRSGGRRYRLVRAEQGQAVFVDADGGYPERLTYRLQGAVLTLTASGLDGSRPVTRLLQRRASEAR